MFKLRLFEVFYGLQRNPNNLDLNKNELLQLLCQVEAELEAREIALAVLKVMNGSL